MGQLFRAAIVVGDQYVQLLQQIRPNLNRIPASAASQDLDPLCTCRSLMGGIHQTGFISTKKGDAKISTS